jgi:hypothetical protein
MPSWLDGSAAWILLEPHGSVDGRFKLLHHRVVAVWGNLLQGCLHPGTDKATPACKQAGLVADSVKRWQFLVIGYSTAQDIKWAT